jgi:hypothetical protein
MSCERLSVYIVSNFHFFYVHKHIECTKGYRMSHDGLCWKLKDMQCKWGVVMQDNQSKLYR